MQLCDDCLIAADSVFEAVCFIFLQRFRFRDAQFAEVRVVMDRIIADAVPDDNDPDLLTVFQFEICFSGIPRLRRYSAIYSASVYMPSL